MFDLLGKATCNQLDCIERSNEQCGNENSLSVLPSIPITHPSLEIQHDGETYVPQNDGAAVSLQPPSFAESQFDVILRRQRCRLGHKNVLKFTKSPSRFQSLSNDFEFAGWGSLQYLELSESSIRKGQESIISEKAELLGSWQASAVAANDVLGGVFYSFPPIIAAASIYSPISLFIAALFLFLWRPIMEELASAFSASGANYTYLINSTSKGIALIAGALAFLDYSATVVVSAATASAYIAGETHLPFPSYVGTIVLVIVPLTISFLGLKESTRTALGILVFHCITMIALSIAASVAWIKHGNVVIRGNWNATLSASPASILHQIFNGVCLGMISLTGFECSPDYSSVVRPEAFPKVMRNIHLPTIGLYSLLMLLVLANMSLDVLIDGTNVLSVLAEKVAGRWMRIWVVVDASIVLSAGVLTGILSACALCEKLSRDRILPKFFQYRIPATGSQAAAITAFTALSGALYATTGASLQIMSSVFALTWLSVMLLFPLSLLILKFNRGRILRTRSASLPLILFTLLLGLVVFAGNIAIDLLSVGYFAVYALTISTIFFLMNKKVQLISRTYWLYDQIPTLHRWRWARRKSDILVKALRRLRRQPVCVLAKSDEIHHLIRMIMYVAKNEETSHLKLVHFYENIDQVPSELEANAKLLDEAFPEITIDLIFIQGPFTPEIVAAVAEELHIPRSLMFMSCPGPEFKIDIAKFGTRIISL